MKKKKFLNLVHNTLQEENKRLSLPKKFAGIFETILKSLHCLILEGDDIQYKIEYPKPFTGIVFKIEAICNKQKILSFRVLKYLNKTNKRTYNNYKFYLTYFLSSKTDTMLYEFVGKKGRYYNYSKNRKMVRIENYRGNEQFIRDCKFKSLEMEFVLKGIAENESKEIVKNKKNKKKTETLRKRALKELDIAYENSLKPTETKINETNGNSKIILKNCPAIGDVKKHKDKTIIDMITGNVIKMSKCFYLTNDKQKEIKKLTKDLVTVIAKEMSIFPIENLLSKNLSKYIEHLYSKFLDWYESTNINFIETSYIFKSLKIQFIQRIAYYNTAYIDSNGKFKKKHSLKWPPQYTQTLHCESKEIAYAHVLPFYPGKCKHLHGHNGKLDLNIKCHTNALSKRPMIISFTIAKEIVNSLHEMLDHKFIWALNPTYPVLINYYATDSKPYIKLKTKTQEITLPFNKNDIVLIPPDSKDVKDIELQNYTTSEKIMNNFIIPRALDILYTKHCFSYYDNKDIEIDLFNEHGYIYFKWWESKTTNISGNFML